MPFNKTEALRRAEEHLSKREITAAIAIHRMIAQADPYDLTTINALGELYVSVGRTKEAIDDFTRIADRYLNSGSGIKAAYLLRKALDLDPSNAPALIKLGEIYLREGMNEKAHDEFIRAGALLASEGQFTGALQANHRAFTAKPGSPQAQAAIAALQADSNNSGPGLVDTKPETGTRRLRSSPEISAEPARRPAASDRSPADEESLIQQLSKAEMLVGYGEVDRAIALLNEVVSHSPDNLDVHGKLKDIYLRNEMIREAALECLELARIHEARGESARANEYTMRAGRLGQSSSHLTNHPPSLAPTDARLTTPTVMPRSRFGEIHSETPEPDLPAERESRNQAPGVLPALSSRTGDPQIQSEAETELVVASPTIRPSSQTMPVRLEAEPLALDSQETPKLVRRGSESPRQSASRQTVVVDPPPANSAVRVSELPAIPGLPESKSERAATRMSSNNLAASAGPDLLLRTSVAPIARRRHWLPIAAMALVGGVALTLVTVKGVSMYGTQLDQQYEELALSLPGTKLSPPGLPSSEDFQPSAEQEAVKIDSLPVPVVTPSGSATELPVAGPEPSPGELTAKTVPSVASEQPKMKPAAAPPPTLAVTDQRVGESLMPRGLPTGAPQTFAPGPSPPPAASTPQRATPIIKGEAIRQAQPDYPAIARTARQEGTVPVEITINENGDVVSARAISGPALLRSPAESAARRWKFRPSTRDGRPLPTVTTINFRFKL